MAASARSSSGSGRWWTPPHPTSPRPDPPRAHGRAARRSRSGSHRTRASRRGRARRPRGHSARLHLWPERLISRYRSLWSRRPRQAAAAATAARRRRPANASSALLVNRRLSFPRFAGVAPGHDGVGVGDDEHVEADRVVLQRAAHGLRPSRPFFLTPGGSRRVPRPWPSVEARWQRRCRCGASAAAGAGPPADRAARTDRACTGARRPRGQERGNGQGFSSTRQERFRRRSLP